MSNPWKAIRTLLRLEKKKQNKEDIPNVDTPIDIEIANTILKNENGTWTFVKKQTNKTKEN